MKIFFVFTLTLLFATCLLLTSVHAHGDAVVSEDWSSGYAGMPFTSVYGYAWSYIVWDHHDDTFYTYHHAFTSNGGNEPVKHYYTFHAELSAHNTSVPKSDGGEEWVPVGETKYADKDFAFGMAGRLNGRYDVTAKTDLVVKLFRNNVVVGSHPWQALCNLDIVWQGFGN